MFIHCHSVHDYPTLPPEAAYKWPLKRGGQGGGCAEWPGCWLRHSLTALSRSLLRHLFGLSVGKKQRMTSSRKGNQYFDRYQLSLNSLFHLYFEAHPFLHFWDLPSSSLANWIRWSIQGNNQYYLLEIGWIRCGILVIMCFPGSCGAL